MMDYTLFAIIGPIVLGLALMFAFYKSQGK